MCYQNHDFGGSHLYIEIAAGTMMEIKTLLWSLAYTLVWKSRGYESVWWLCVMLYITKQNLVIWVFVWWRLLYADTPFVLCFSSNAMADYSSGRRRICVTVCAHPFADFGSEFNFLLQSCKFLACSHNLQEKLRALALTVCFTQTCLCTGLQMWNW